MYDTKKWQTTRARKLRDQWECELKHPGCEIIATEVHHRHAIQDGGRPYAPDNLVSACTPCHSQETRREQLARTGGGSFFVSARSVRPPVSSPRAPRKTRNG